MSKTHNIPEIGEIGSADRIPAKRQVAKITVGSATTNDVVLSATAAYTLLGVDEPVIVFGVWTQVKTPFTASVTLAIGDSGSAGRFVDTGTVAATVSGAVLVAASGLAVPYVYAAAQDILLDVNGATVAAGQMDVFVEYAILSE